MKLAGTLLGSADESDDGRRRERNGNGSATIEVSLCPTGNEVERFGRHTRRGYEKNQ